MPATLQGQAGVLRPTPPQHVRRIFEGIVECRGRSGRQMEFPGEWNRITAALASAWDPERTDPETIDEVWAVLVDKRLVHTDDASRASFLQSIEAVLDEQESPPRPGPSPWWILASRLDGAGIVRTRGLRVPRGRRLLNLWRRVRASARNPGGFRS